MIVEFPTEHSLSSQPRLRVVFALLFFFGIGLFSTQGQNRGIGIRRVNNIAEFFDQATGMRVALCGTNYVRLVPQMMPNGRRQLYHSTFNVNLYDTAIVGVALREMREARYNVVRVFINHLANGGIAARNGKLSRKYVRNIVDFLRRAERNRIYVILTLDWIPVPVGWRSLDGLWSQDFACTNMHVLSQAGLEANRLFFAEFVKELQRLRAPLHRVLAYELRNELTFEPHLPPLSLTEGVVTSANGSSYDLADPEQKRQLVEEGAVFWVDELRSTIRSLDTTARVTVGLVPPKDAATSLAQGRLSITVPILHKSTIDFVDVHIYPIIDGVTMREFVDRFGLSGYSLKPYIMGELGASRNVYASADVAARALRKWQHSSIQYGFSGWLLWAWDLHELPETFSAQDHNKEVNRAIAPVYQTSLSLSGNVEVETEESNIARGKPTTASREQFSNPAAKAVDGTSFPWISGGTAPQWIEINLQQPTSFRLIRLIVNQNPAGKTRHQVLVRGPDEEYRLLHEFRKQTQGSELLEFVDELANIQYVKVSTLESPSWVAWGEIEIVK
jgi:hypothetical protein